MMCQRCRREPAKLYFRGLNICWTCFSAHPSQGETIKLTQRVVSDDPRLERK